MTKKNVKTAEHTDLGNSERFVRDHAVVLRFVGSWGKWLGWDGARWVTDATGTAERLAKESVRGLLAAAGNEHRAALNAIERAGDDEELQNVGKERLTKVKPAVEWALQSHEASRIRSMVALAKSASEFAVTHDDSTPTRGSSTWRTGRSTSAPASSVRTTRRPAHEARAGALQRRGSVSDLGGLRLACHGRQPRARRLRPAHARLRHHGRHTRTRPRLPFRRRREREVDLPHSGARSPRLRGVLQGERRRGSRSQALRRGASPARCDFGQREACRQGHGWLARCSPGRRCRARGARRRLRGRA